MRLGRRLNDDLPMQLQDERPWQTNGVLQGRQTIAKVLIDVPQKVPKDTGRYSLVSLTHSQ